MTNYFIGGVVVVLFAAVVWFTASWVKDCHTKLTAGTVVVLGGCQ